MRREELLSFCLDVDLDPLGSSRTGWHRLVDCVGRWWNGEIGFAYSLEHRMGFGLELVGCLQLGTVIGKGIALYCLCGRFDSGFVLVRYSAEAGGGVGACWKKVGFVW